MKGLTTFNVPPRKQEQNHSTGYGSSSSIQKAAEEIVLKLAKNIAKETNEKNLCLVGVALNRL